jgi:CHAT domain-containing protein
LWKVDDDATKDFMKAFYDYLIQKNETPAEALHDAQASMIATSLRHDPYYWAGFVLEGDWRRF